MKFKLITFGAILFCSGFVLTILTWPYALDIVEVDMEYAVASGIIFIIIFTGQLMSVIATAMFSHCIEEFEKSTKNTSTNNTVIDNPSANNTPNENASGNNALAKNTPNKKNTSTEEKSIWKKIGFFHFLIVIIYLVIWFSCGAGQLVIVVLMVINVEVNDDVGVKAYGGTIIALTVIYMFASSVYSTVVFIWFYHKWKQQVQKETSNIEK